MSPLDRTFGADVHPVAALDVAGNLAHDDDFASLNAGINLPLRPIVTRLSGMMILPSMRPSM